MAILTQGKYKLAQTKITDRESSGFTKSFLKLPPGVNVYKLKAGKAKIDIVPYVAGKRNPDAEEGMLYWKMVFWVHRNIGPNRDTVVCPAKTIGKPCPICEEYNRQMRTNPDDEEYKQIQELKPKEWELMQIRDREAKEKGLQILPLSFHRLSDKIAEQVSMGEEGQNWENFWHPKGGKALLVNFGEDTSGKNKYLRAKGVNFLDRQDLPDGLIDKGLCLDDCLIVYKYDKLVELFGEPDSKTEEENTESEETETETESEEGLETTEEAAEEETVETSQEETEAEAEPAEAEEEEAPAPPAKKKPAAGKSAAKPSAKKAPPAEPEEEETEEQTEKASEEEPDWNAFDKTEEETPAEETEEAPEAEAEEEVEEEAPKPPKKPAPKAPVKPAAKPTGKPAVKPTPKKK